MKTTKDQAELDFIEVAERLMKIADLAEGIPKGFVTPNFVNAVERELTQALSLQKKRILEALPEEISSQEAEDRRLEGWNFALKQVKDILKKEVGNKNE